MFSSKCRISDLLVLGLMLSLTGVGRGEVMVSPDESVRVEGRVATDQDRKEAKGADTVSQSKTFTFTITGKPKSPETRTAKWTVYGRNLKDSKIVEVKSGEFKIDLSTRTQVEETKKITTAYTPEHSQANPANPKGAGANKKKAGPPTFKKVSAEGIKYIGYAVVVRNGTQVVGEFSDPSGLKADDSK